MEWVLFAGGVLAIGVSLVLGYRERRDFARWQREAEERRPGELEELSLLVADLQQELARTAERITGELEERAQALRRLIEEARTTEVELRGGKDAEDPAPVAHATEEGPGQAREWRTVEAEVWRLHQEGLGVEQIARRLDVGKGEVKLILNLKKAQAR